MEKYIDCGNPGLLWPGHIYLGNHRRGPEEEMKPIIPGDSKIDKELDKHFSKRGFKTSKLINPEKLYTKIMAEAQDHHEQFMPKKAKSYKAVFDNGWAMGYYEGLCKAAKIIMKNEVT